MEQEYTRSQYFSIKHRYMFYKFLLSVMRILGIAFFVISLIIVFIFSNMGALNESLQKTYDILSMCATIILPVSIALWIIAKIVVVIFRKKLRGIKYYLDIVDEI